MYWNNTKQRRPAAKKPRRRNRGVEQQNRKIREVRALLRSGAQTISEILRNGATDEGGPMDSPGASSDDASALINDTAYVIQRLTVQATVLRAEFIGLDYDFKQCGHAFVELLEVVADRLDALVTPARYRR